MTYSTVADIYHSAALMERATAGVASEVSAGSVDGDASVSNAWVTRRAWDLASTPGWAAKWESAIAGGITDPGASGAVITDGDLLSRLQALLAVYPLDDLLPPPVTP